MREGGRERADEEHEDVGEVEGEGEGEEREKERKFEGNAVDEDVSRRPP